MVLPSALRVCRRTTMRSQYVETHMDENEAQEGVERPYGDTEARRLLAGALDRAQKERGWSQRDVAARLGYRSSVVLSHMAGGRIPIPIDRAPEIARVLDLEFAPLTVAILKQRFPDIDFDALFGVHAAQPSRIVAELEALAGTPLDELPREKHDLLRQVVWGPDPGRQWLALSEVTAVEALREAFPEMRERGLNSVERMRLMACLGRNAGESDAD